MPFALDVNVIVNGLQAILLLRMQGVLVAWGIGDGHGLQRSIHCQAAETDSIAQQGRRVVSFGFQYPIQLILELTRAAIHQIDGQADTGMHHANFALFGQQL